MHTKVIQIGDRKIGGGNPIAIQSMTNTKTEDVKATVEQILRLEKAGSQIFPQGICQLIVLSFLNSAVILPDAVLQRDAFFPGDGRRYCED